MSAAPALAQCSGGIPNFQVTGLTPGADITLSWDPPAGAPNGTIYEIVRTTAPDYCSLPSGTVTVFRTLNTTYTAVLDVPSSAYSFSVRLASIPSVETGCQYVDDNFGPPVKPNLAGSATTPGQADLTFSESSPTAFISLQLFRGTTAAAQPDLVGAFLYCPAGQTFSYTDFGPNGSAATGGTLSGPYYYRMDAYNFGTKTGANGIPSDLVAINVVPTCSAPAAPRNPTIQSAANPTGPVTGTDFLRVSWLAPATGQAPSGYDYRVNGDPFTSVAGTEAIAPPRGGNDPITLTVRAHSCSPAVAGPEVSSSVFAPAAPVANFSSTSPARVGQPIVFTDTSSPQAVSWLWLFDDGTSSTAQSPSKVFTDARPHQIALIASNGSGSSVKLATINVVSASAAVATASRERRAFLATADPSRRTLSAVRLSGEGLAFLYLRSLEESDAVVYLRFLDRAGNGVLERRLVASPGPEAAYDLGAFGLSGDYGLEIVTSQNVLASVWAESAAPRVPRIVKRGHDEP